MEDYEKSRAGILVEKIFKLVFRAARTKAAAYPIMETLGGTAIVIAICYGGWQVIEETRSTGTFFSFVTALLLAYDPVKKLVNLNAQLQEGLAATERVFRILDVHPKIVDHPNALRVDKAKGAAADARPRRGEVGARRVAAAEHGRLRRVQHRTVGGEREEVHQPVAVERRLGKDLEVTARARGARPASSASRTRAPAPSCASIVVGVVL